MPSEQCFVYITLPGQTEPVTAGRYQLDTGRQGTAVGQFVYGRSYIIFREATGLNSIPSNSSFRCRSSEP
jgi:hypothetical protein